MTTSEVIARLTVTSLLFGTLLTMSVSACFIRNCPMGGKRSLEEVPTIPTQRKCMACGPTGLGQCVGPNICCEPDGGCYINTDESAPCVQENDSTTPCEIEGATCDNGSGYCMADSVCCNDEQCMITSECRRRNHRNRDTPMSHETISYLKKLLQLNAFVNRG